MFRALSVFLFLTWSAAMAQAQDNSWVQIAARSTLSTAQDFARDYDRRVDGVHGFYIGSGFYGIVLGPYDRPTAEAVRRQLLSQGQIPSDSFITDGGSFRQQFWPIGGGIRQPQAANTQPDPEQVIVSVEPTEIPDETVREARNSERDLSRAEREDLQIALRWAGFYNAAIDGSFGRGTRASMESWQIANNQEATGVLTTRQRAVLLQQYNAVLEQAEMRIARDVESGIEMQIPTAMVSFSEYQPPFVKFTPSGDVPKAQVLFISQSGDRDTLRGLYEVMQILDIVPPEGERRFGRDSFVIEGVGDGVHSYTTATLQDGAIKGFTLVWPEGDEQRRSRILGVMQDSFTSLDGTLDPDIAPASMEQSVDMVAGLAVRKPRMTRSGFYIANDGHVLTTTEAVQSCERITFARDIDATVLATDPDLGVAVLAPETPQAPISIAALDTNIQRLRTRIAVAGFPFAGILSNPTLTFGEIADIRSLTGDTRLDRLQVIAQDGDAGGPVLNERGDVLGMLVPKPSENGQVLPSDVSFALKASQITPLLEASGIAIAAPVDAAPLGGVALARRAAELTVLVSCW